MQVLENLEDGEVIPNGKGYLVLKQVYIWKSHFNDLYSCYKGKDATSFNDNN